MTSQPTHASRAITILTAELVASQLRGRERELIDLAGQAYVTHGRGLSRLPQSEYLRFPGMERERIIPKAGYLGGDHPAAGIKWIASFPDNVGKGLARASALMILNDLDTGRPTTVMEGSLISGQRTAAGAALAARTLHRGERYERVGVIGCGPINSETLRFLLADRRPVGAIGLFDLDAARMESFAADLRALGFQGEIAVAPSAEALLGNCDLLAFGTSAVVPSVSTLAVCRPGTTVLHTSLRDFSPAAVLEADNVVDDVDHVLQANTSLHLAEQQTGRRDFVRATLAQVLEGNAPARAGDGARCVLYSPFGLAALDLAFGEFVARRCREAGQGIVVPDFLP